MTDNWDKAKEQIAEAYHNPPEVPRDEMWQAIEGRLEQPEVEVHSLEAHRRRRPAWGWGTMAAAAAGLVLWAGFGLGRATAPAGDAGDQETMPPVAEAPAVAPQRDSRVRLAATRHLVATRTLLGQVGSGVAAGSINDEVGTWARQLLTDTRLMLDSPAGEQDELRTLLEDLELILVQVVHASNAGKQGDAGVGRMEMQQLTQGLRDNDVLPRIQRMLPPVMGAAD